METQDGSKYVSLAVKLDELSQVCAQLSRENAELRAQMSRLTARISSERQASQGEPRDGSQDGRFSRRRLGKALAASAAGVVGAAALVDATARPAAAATGSSILAGEPTTAEAATTVQYDGSAGEGVILLANDKGNGSVATDSAFPAALAGWAGSTVSNGIYGFTAAAAGHAIVGRHASTNGPGSAIVGISDSKDSNTSAIIGTIENTSPGGFTAGVRGVNNSTTAEGIGVWGSQAGAGWGVYGTSAAGIGVNADAGGSGGTGVSAFGGNIGVFADGGQIGIDAVGPVAVSAKGNKTGVSAIGPTGVHGSGSGTAGVGVHGSGAGSGGRGGIFNGGAAQVKLSPGSLSTHPKSGQRGDLYADNKGRLWFCKTGGTSATWHQIA